MQGRSKPVLAALVAMAVAAPTAGAMPIQDGGAHVPVRPAEDMHASTVGPALESSVTAGDLRTEAAKSRAESRAAVVPVPGDLRTEAAKEPLVPPGLPAYPSPVEPPVAPGLPTFPTATEPLAPPASQPTAATDGGDDWFGWPLAGLIAAGVLALGGAALAARHQLRGQAGAAH